MNERARLGQSPQLGRSSVAQQGTRPSVEHSRPEDGVTARLTCGTGIDPGLKALPTASPQSRSDAVGAHANGYELGTGNDAALNFGKVAQPGRQVRGHDGQIARADRQNGERVITA